MQNHMMAEALLPISMPWPLPSNSWALLNSTHCNQYGNA